MENLVGHGRTADVFGYGENKVIKVFHKQFSHLAVKEYERVKIIDSLEISAPYAYEILDIDGKKCIVYEYIKGISMLQSTQKKPLKIRIYAKQLADMHAAIHSRPAPALPNIKESLSSAICSVQSINKKDKDAILGYLETLPDGDRLCHYDFHPGNVMIFNGNASVIDWMTAGRGDPCADICRTSLILRSNVQPYDMPAIKKLTLHVFRKIFYRNYIRQYLQTTGISIQQVERWLLPVAAARLNEKIESELPYLKSIIHQGLLTI
jgi:aminoglycoside phosphotransferase (APT) family kinase protein